ncbi:hypothetical protein C8R43DRAFT_680871 [Mycena crocata]|nr:hypothetical protein C8R43DRAFT_680871 [Mycena crocata]
MAAALFPLAAITLLVTASISGPASIFFRRVVQPVPRAEIPPEEDPTAKQASSLLGLFQRACISVFATLRIPSQRATFLPVFLAQNGFSSAGNIEASSSHEVDPLMHAEVSNFDSPEGTLVSESAGGELDTGSDEPEPDAMAIRIAPPPYTRRLTRCVPPPSCAYVDFTIGWNDIWPESLPSPQVEYTYNSYYNAYMCSLPLEPVLRTGLDISSHDDDDEDDEDDSESEIDALELASRSADDDLLSVFHALYISEITPPSRASSHVQLPPAGLSPFCPPPLPNPSPPQLATTTTWRLEWY